MTKHEIIEQLKKLLEQSALEVQKELKQLEKEYKKIWTEEFEKAKQTFIDEGGKAKDFVYVKSKEDEEIAELIARFEKKKEAEEKKRDALRRANKQKKEELISQLEALAEADIKDITVIIKKLREIQNKWKEIKELHKADYAELQRKYNTLLDKINDNIKAFDTLRQYDFQKNTTAKENLLLKLEQLLSLEDIKKVEDLYKTYKKEWNQIGEVISEKYTEIRTRFNELNQKIKEKIKTFYNTLEEEKKKNLEQKQQLLKELQTITTQLSNAQHIVWKNINEQIQKIKSKWEKIGHIPIEAHKEIHQQYHQLLDIYYEAKRKNYEYIQQKQAEIKSIKEKILNELEQLKNNTDWENTTKRIIQLQNDWKKLYLRDKEENDKLNTLFKQYCNEFFENKKNAEKEKRQTEKDNLVKKLDLIQKLKTTSFDKNKPEESLQKIQEFIQEFNTIGHVPIEEKERIHNEFFSQINHIIAELEINEEKIHTIQYKAKLQQLIQSAHNPIDTLVKEEKFIKRKINELETEMAQIENNLAFFRNSKPDNPLLKEIYQKKEKITHFINEWKHKLNLLQSMLGELKKIKQQTT